MTQAPQEISITYNSFVIDDTTKANYLILDNSWSIRYSDINATVSFKVLVKGSDESDFFAKEALFREAFRDIRKALVISLSGSTYYTWSVSSTPHADSVPKVELLNDEHFTNRTCAFSVSVDVTMKAITSRRSENVLITTDASGIRTLTASATYNATASLGAYQSYQSDFGTFCDGVISFIDAREGSATWEQVQDPSLTTNTVVNNQLVISRVFKELIFSQSESTLDDPDLVDMKFSIDFSIPQPGDSTPDQGNGVIVKQNPLRPTECVVVVTANIPKATTDLESVYEGKIKPYILNHARSRGGFSAMAVTNPKVNYDRVSNIISATFNITGAIQGSGQVLSSLITVNVKENLGNLLVGAHDGTKFGRYVVPIKGERTMTVTETIQVIGSGSVSGAGGGNIGFYDQGNQPGIFGGGNPFGGGLGTYEQGSQGQLNFGPGDSGGGGSSGSSGGGNGRWVKMTTDRTDTPRVIGTVAISNENFPVIETQYIETFSWVTDPVQGAAGGGSTGGVPAPITQGS